MTQERTCKLIDMESAEEDAEQQALVDSGTGSCNESPVTDEDSSQSGVAEIRHRGGSNGEVRNILDKSISVDEDSLIAPLEPVVCTMMNTAAAAQDSAETLPRLMSILRRTSCFDLLLQLEEPETSPSPVPMKPRRVSFPADLTVLASYKEPDLRSPFNLCDTLSCEEILQIYEASCKKHQTIELDVIKSQIMDIKSNVNYSAELSLAAVNVTMEVCETLEDLFKVVNFRTVVLKPSRFSPETVSEFINILEYYNCACEYVVTEQFREQDAWKSFCHMTSTSFRLESLTFEGFDFGESHSYMKALTHNIQANDSIQTLKFSNCKLGQSQALLFETLSCNTTIQELYLPQARLYTKEADPLGRLLSRNRSLKVLDISNNFIGDRGLEVLAKGLCSGGQTQQGCGLTVLIIFNNQITEKSGPVIGNIIAECTNLRTLNVGYNQLTDELIYKIEEGLTKTCSLEGLGLQSTLLTDKGIGRLAEVIQNNMSLEKINIKGNKAIQADSLEKLSKALTNTKITKIEVDETNRNCDDPQAFLELVKQINAICTVNKSRRDQLADEEISIWSMYSRKVSLNCEPIYAQPLLTEPPASGVGRKKSPCPSPIPSPGCSPTPRSRFSVSRVPEQPKPSRFRVEVVSLPHPAAGGDSHPSPLARLPRDDVDDSKFANVRSSVSSIDSVDSVSTNRDDSATPSGESD